MSASDRIARLTGILSMHPLSAMAHRDISAELAAIAYDHENEVNLAFDAGEQRGYIDGYADCYNDDWDDYDDDDDDEDDWLDEDDDALEHSDDIMPHDQALQDDPDSAK